MQIDKTALTTVIFDLDGTLADTFPLIVSSWNAAVREPMGRTYSADEVVARFGPPDPAMLRQELPERAWNAAIETYHSHYEAAHDQVTPFEGVPELLNALAERGLKMGVMTGKGRRTADITVRALGWNKFFQSVVTGEDVAQPKPAPDGILLVMRELNAQPAQCVYIGDSPADIEAGQAAGMPTIAAAWHSYYGERLRATEPDYWAATPVEVLSILCD